MIDPERWTHGHEERVHVWETVVVTMVTLCNRNHSADSNCSAESTIYYVLYDINHALHFLL